jgi:hypothetical protein
MFLELPSSLQAYVYVLLFRVSTDESRECYLVLMKRRPEYGMGCKDTATHASTGNARKDPIRLMNSNSNPIDLVLPVSTCMPPSLETIGTARARMCFTSWERNDMRRSKSSATLFTLDGHKHESTGRHFKPLQLWQPSEPGAPVRRKDCSHHGHIIELDHLYFCLSFRTNNTTRLIGRLKLSFFPTESLRFLVLGLLYKYNGASSSLNATYSSPQHLSSSKASG